MKVCYSILAAAVLWIAPAVASGGQSSKSPVVKTMEVAQGEIVELRVSGNGLMAVTGRLGNETVYFYPSDSENYAAVVGVDLEAKAGVTNVFVQGLTQSGTQRDTQIALRIKPKAFRKESFAVAPKFDQFGPDVLERIAFEREQMAGAYAGAKPERLWDGSFLAPVPKQVTSPFGYRRVINGAPRSPHTGVDLKAAMGAQILAPNHGRVALLGDFFFSGKSLVLDHGAGLFTMYFHLSEFKVKEGGEVRKGEILGLAGMSGRATGPHLHWGARLNGARIDPFELVEKLGGNGTIAAAPDKKMEKLETEDGEKRSGR